MTNDVIIWIWFFFRKSVPAKWDFPERLRHPTWFSNFWDWNQFSNSSYNFFSSQLLLIFFKSFLSLFSFLNYLMVCYDLVVVPLQVSISSLYIKRTQTVSRGIKSRSMVLGLEFRSWDLFFLLIFVKFIVELGFCFFFTSLAFLYKASNLVAQNAIVPTQVLYVLRMQVVIFL